MYLLNPVSNNIFYQNINLGLVSLIFLKVPNASGKNSDPIIIGINAIIRKIVFIKQWEILYVLFKNKNLSYPIFLSFYYILSTAFGDCYWTLYTECDQ